MVVVVAIAFCTMQYSRRSGFDLSNCLASAKA
jgi:hypothetical protein